MTSPRLLIPLRVPELGPAMGRLVTGTGGSAPGLPPDGARVRLVTRLFEAAGEARRLADHGERDAALAGLASGTWLDAWDEAVGATAAALVEHVNRRLAAEATAARMPARRRRDVLLDDVETGAVTARLGAAGAELVPALDRLDHAVTRLRGATALERDALEEWQAALTTAARRLEAAWLALAEQVATELTRWDAVATQVAAWRKSPWPPVIAGVPLLALALWLGLLFGGYLEPPAWFARLWELLAP